MKKYLVIIFLGILIWNGYPQRFYDARGYWSGQVRSLSKQLQDQHNEMDALKAEYEQLSGPGFHGGALGLKYPAAAVEDLKAKNEQKQQQLAKRIESKTHALMEAQLQLSWSG